MSTPAEHVGSPITIAGALLDAASASPDAQTKARLFQEAWRIALPQLAPLAKRALNGDSGDHLANTLSDTAKKLWRSVQTGYTPQHGFEAILPRVPKLAASTVLERDRKHRDNPTLHIDQIISEHDEDQRQAWLAVDELGFDAVHDDDERTRNRALLRRASQRAAQLQHPHASLVLRSGIGDRDTTTAKTLGITVREYRLALQWIHTEHYALMIVSDHRFAEYLQESFGLQLDLAMAVGA